MKKIGLVGGTGPESTAMYYKELNSQIDALTNGKAMPDISVESVNFRRAWDLVSNEKYDELADYLCEKVDCLKKTGCEVIALTAVTMHMVYEKIEDKTGVKLVSIPEAVAEDIVNKGITKVGLLGTVFTMEQDYMKKDLLKRNVEVFVPDDKERELIGKRIFEELENGIVKRETEKELIDIINRMKNENGIEGVILGCTELPLILNEDNCPVTCLDSVKIHLDRLIKLAME